MSNCLVTARQWSCRKVCFSVVSVCPSVHRRYPRDYYLWYIGHHSTGLLDIESHCTGPPTPTQPQPPPMLVTLCLVTGNHPLRPVQTCSLENTSPTLKHVQLATGRCTSCWNAFVFLLSLEKVPLVFFSMSVESWIIMNSKICTKMPIS